ncbi:MAG: 16S rRNA (guanine(527)-N(7))-methyltransferase RsmG [Gammaproteobacteria bacterium]|nr:16S rRNA (guanine(527)-N(7))-methyltransferase RsmG [Gammaproteobacteria bacterium]
MPSESVLERQLKAGIRGISELDLSSSQIKTLSTYCRLVAQWNRAYNLIGARTLPEIVPRHLLDSLVLSSFLPPDARRILDFGTGAGLPGLPLAVVHPERQFVLLDRSRKKTRFVRQAKLELDLPNVEVVTSEVGHYRGDPFECIMARAVDSLGELVRSSEHLIGTEGVYLFPKGLDIERELHELPQGWNASVMKLEKSTAGSSTRTVVVLRSSDAAAEGS